MRILQASIIAYFLVFIGCANSSKDKEVAHLHLKIGTAYLSQGKNPLAIRELLLAKELDPENPVIFNNLGLAYLMRGKYALAEEQLKQAIELNPKYTEAKNNLGRIYIERANYRLAIKTLKEVTNDLTYPFPEKALVNLGLAYFYQSKFEPARKNFLKAIRMRRSYCLAHSYYGRSLLELKKFQKAASALDHAIGLCKKSNYDEPHYYSALSYYKQGSKKRAVARLEEVINLYSTGKYSQKAKKMLKEINGSQQ